MSFDITGHKLSRIESTDADGSACALRPDPGPVVPATSGALFGRGDNKSFRLGAFFESPSP